MPELDGMIDLHVHAGPDVRERKMTGLELARAARAAGLRGFLLKNHHTSTVPLAAAVREQVPEVAAFGGIALNEWVGGLNPAAAEAAIRMGAKEIWLPTLSAENERAHQGRPRTGISVLRGNGALAPEVHEIIRLAAAADVMLGTGHLSPCEIAAVVRAAKEAGARKIVVTHPEIRFIQLPVSVQKDLAGPGVWFERCYARALFALDWDGLAASVREVGVASTVLATDLGQPDNPDPLTGLAGMAGAFRARGFSDAELDLMMRRNPAGLLGLE
jgi:hypothetical protein